MRDSALVTILALVGCGADYETEHLRITTHFDAPLCAGNLDTYEQSIDVLEAELGRSLDTPLDVDLWHVRDWLEEGDKHCADDSDACYSRQSHRIFGIMGTTEISHELVHAIVRYRTDQMVQEGVAVALTDVTTFSRWRPQFVPSGGAVSYASAGHFMRWVTETRGRDCTRALLSVRHDDVEETFASQCGSSFDAAVDAYSETAPWAYPNPLGCDFSASEVETLTANEPLDFAVTLDCDAVDTTASDTGMFAMRTLVVEEAGRWSMWTDGSGMVVRRCEGETIALASPYWVSDERIPPVTSVNGRGVLGKRAGNVWLDPGEHQLVISVAGWDAQTVRVRLDPTVPIERVP